MLAVVGWGELAEACCFLQSSACLRLRFWASKQGHASFAGRRVLAVAAGCTFKWLSMEEALNIFGRYEEYHKTNIADFGLYRREYFALKEYKAHVR